MTPLLIKVIIYSVILVSTNKSLLLRHLMYLRPREVATEPWFYHIEQEGSIGKITCY